MTRCFRLSAFRIQNKKGVKDSVRKIDGYLSAFFFFEASTPKFKNQKSLCRPNPQTESLFPTLCRKLRKKRMRALFLKNLGLEPKTLKNTADVCFWGKYILKMWLEALVSYQKKGNMHDEIEGKAWKCYYLWEPRACGYWGNNYLFLSPHFFLLSHEVAFNVAPQR